MSLGFLIALLLLLVVAVAAPAAVGYVPFEQGAPEKWLSSMIISDTPSGMGPNSRPLAMILRM